MGDESMGTISVIVPTFNRSALLRATLSSILAQTRPADEVIVVDDESTDDTAEVVASFGSAVTFLRQPNSGPLIARNLGLRTARGRLVAFCDSDDLWDPGFLAAMAHAFTLEPALIGAYSNFRILHGGSLSGRTKFDDAPPGFWDNLRTMAPGLGRFASPIVSELLEFQPFFPSCMMADRAAFLALGGWDEGVSRIIGCDFATALRIGNAPPLGVVQAPLVSIRKHEGNISRNTEEMNLGNARVLEYVLRTRPELAIYRDEVLASVTRRRVDALHNAFARRDFEAVRRIGDALPLPARAGRVTAKRAIAGLPQRMARGIAALLSEPAE